MDKGEEESKNLEKQYFLAAKIIQSRLSIYLFRAFVMQFLNHVDRFQIIWPNNEAAVSTWPFL
jgi:hypothetical protein